MLSDQVWLPSGLTAEVRAGSAVCARPMAGQSNAANTARAVSRRRPERFFVGKRTLSAFQHLAQRSGETGPGAFMPGCSAGLSCHGRLFDGRQGKVGRAAGWERVGQYV